MVRMWATFLHAHFKLPCKTDETLVWIAQKQCTGQNIATIILLSSHKVAANRVFNRLANIRLFSSFFYMPFRLLTIFQVTQAHAWQDFQRCHFCSATSIMSVIMHLGTTNLIGYQQQLQYPWCLLTSKALSPIFPGFFLIYLLFDSLCNITGLTFASPLLRNSHFLCISLRRHRDAATCRSSYDPPILSQLSLLRSFVLITTFWSGFFIPFSLVGQKCCAAPFQLAGNDQNVN